MSGTDANEFLRHSMQTLLDLRFVWSKLHAPNWGGCSFHGDARAVDWRLNLQIEQEPFTLMSIHEINTLGRWTHGHNHEQGFVSFVVSGEYESCSWSQHGEERLGEQLDRYPAGSVVPFADVERYHSLRSCGPVRTIVLWMPAIVRRRPFDPTLPRVTSHRIESEEVRRRLDSVREEFMCLRTKMRRQLPPPSSTVA